jgi:hypothetical protein
MTADCERVCFASVGFASVRASFCFPFRISASLSFTAAQQRSKGFSDVIFRTADFKLLLWVGAAVADL